ncbi:MAG: hypothetical protein DI535_06575 [Citrobacter freundii]|nr:MAG: hypothetical protein DI535_06575 [Citrobacter freundii]
MTANPRGPGGAILKAWLIAGTMDILSAFIKFILEGKTNVEVILKYIASGLLGTSAMRGGAGTAAFGLFLHYVIALIFTVILFFLYGKLKLIRFNPVLIGILYGIFTWLVMNLVVVPYSKVPRPPGPFNWPQAVIAALILIVCIGLPVSLIARKYYLYKK